MLQDLYLLESVLVLISVLISALVSVSVLVSVLVSALVLVSVLKSVLVLVSEGISISQDLLQQPGVVVRSACRYNLARPAGM